MSVNQNPHLSGGFDYFFTDTFWDNLDFKRLAVFFLITPALTVLSRTWKTLGNIFRASSVFFCAKNLRYSLTVSFMLFLYFIFLVRRVIFWRRAFLADLVIGIYLVSGQKVIRS